MPEVETTATAENTAESKPKPEWLIQSLINAHAGEDRAVLAKLRRGLGKRFGETGAADRDGWVLTHTRDEDYVAAAELDRRCLVASLFALHSLPGRRRSMGEAFRKLQTANPDADGPERRFVALLDSHSDDLPDRLRHAISLLKSNEIPVDWQRLLRDLRSWTHPDRWVQRRWAREFWSSGKTKKSDKA